MSSLLRIIVDLDVNCRRNTKFECSICKKTIVGEDQWQQHIHGRVHKRHVEGQKRKEAMEKYFKSKKQ